MTRDRVQYPFVGDPEAAKAALAAAPPEPVDHAGEWEQVGAAAAWRATVAGAVLNGRLYTVEKKGLWETDLATGARKAVGKPGLGAVQLLFAAGDRLGAVNKAGDLFRIDPATGEKERLGGEAALKGTLAGAVLGDKLYTAEDDGRLYLTSLESRQSKQVGHAEFGDTKFMFAAGDHLYTIEKDGSLYKVDPKEGEWVQLGGAGEWKETLAGVVLKGKLYTTESNGCFYETDLNSGAWVQLGNADFGDTKFMFAAGEDVCTIEKSGSLYRVHVK